MFFPYSTYESQFYNSKFDTLVPLPEDTLEQNEPIIRSYVEQFNQTEPTIFMLTGEKNTVFDELNQPKIRVRRATDVAAKVLKFPNKNEPCAYMYVSKIDIVSYGEKDQKPEKYEFTKFEVSNGSCSDKSKTEPRAESIEFTMANETPKNFKVTIKFNRARTYV